MTDFKGLVFGLICINIVMYLFGAGLGITVVDDPVSRMFDTTELAGGNPKFNNTIESKVEDIEVSQGIISGAIEFFTDGLGMIFDILKIIFNILVAPSTFFTAGLHATIRVLIGVPILIANLVAIVTMIRGAS